MIASLNLRASKDIVRLLFSTKSKQEQAIHQPNEAIGFTHKPCIQNWSSQACQSSCIQDCLWTVCFTVYDNQLKKEINGHMVLSGLPFQPIYMACNQGTTFTYVASYAALCTKL